MSDEMIGACGLTSAVMKTARVDPYDVEALLPSVLRLAKRNSGAVQP